MSAELYNAAALRDAAESLLDLLGDFGIDEETVAISHADKVLRESMKTERTLAVLRKARAALAKSPRNCDSAEDPEQMSVRFMGEVCDQYDNDWEDPRTQCPHDCVRCVIKWMLENQNESENWENLRNRSMEYLDDRMLRMADWKYPLTNVSRFAQNQRSRKTAVVRDADGNVICTFAGLPYRRNKAAVAMASEFVEHMNAEHAGLKDVAVTEARRRAWPLQCVCGGIGVQETRIISSGSTMIAPLYEMRIHCLRCDWATNWYDDGAKAEDEWNILNSRRW